MSDSRSAFFELETTDMGGRTGILSTKTSKLTTPALLPVIHPVRQLVPCAEIRSMGYEAVMTNAYTTFRRLRDRASEGIHRIIGFDGTIMTDSGGYQVLEFGSVDIDPVGMAKFEEEIGSDIAIVLDKPTGLDVTKAFANKTVAETLRSAAMTASALSRKDILWTIPIQGGKYLDLIEKSSKASARLGYDCFALGSPVEVMEGYDFSLLVEMIRASKQNLPVDRPFHLFGAGHPLAIPLGVALGCDMFDSASYMLYAKQDRYISSGGTIRLERLEYLPCVCRVCSSLTASELKSQKKEERAIAIARHNLYALKQVVEETKQAIWEGRLWEYVKSKCSNHPASLRAFNAAFASGYSSRLSLIDLGTPDYKDRGIFVFDEIDSQRPEVLRHAEKMRKNLDLSEKNRLVIAPETKTKPFLVSDLLNEIVDLVDLQSTLVCYVSPIFGLVPAEISDIFPISQVTLNVNSYPRSDYVLTRKKWERIDALLRRGDPAADWLGGEIKAYERSQRAKKKKIASVTKSNKTRIVISQDYKSFKAKLAQV